MARAGRPVLVLSVLAVPPAGRLGDRLRGRLRRPGRFRARRGQLVPRHRQRENAVNGKQYGFPDDDGAGQSSDISVANPEYMIVAVGW
jgi:hypothetical protein